MNSDDPIGIIELEVNLENAEGKVTTPCFAEVELPFKK